MLPKWHILLGGIFSLALHFLLEVSLINSSLVFLASVFIDIDHYLFYVIRFKNWNLKQAYLWHKKIGRKHKPVMHIFHSIEFLFLVLVLSLFLEIFLFILVGMLFHTLLDITDMAMYQVFSREHLLLRYLLTKDKSKYL